MKTKQENELEDRIIEAAKKVFVEKGYEETNMSNIAAEVGITRSSLHYYFRTKEKMFAAVSFQLIQTFIPHLHEIIDSEATMPDKLKRFIDQYTSMLLENPFLPMFVLRESQRDAVNLISEIDAVLQEANFRLLKDKIEEYMEKGLLKKTPVKDIISTFSSLLIFPLLSGNMFTLLFFNGDKTKFKKYIIERKTLVFQIMSFLLLPEKEHNQQ